MKPTLDIEVRDLLSKRRADWPRIAADAKVSLTWIRQFVRHAHQHDPGYRRLCNLHGHLKVRSRAKPTKAAA